jgi:hypothetical protein
MAYQLVPACKSPSLDLSKTVLSCAVSAETDALITHWMQRHISRFAWCNRIGIVGINIGFFVPRAVGKPLMAACTALCVLGMTPTALFLNVPLLRLLVRQYDFWTFSMFNTINWVFCAILFGDLRAAACFSCWLNTMLIICIDANTRTLTTLVRGATLWLPGAVVITVACLFHLCDIDDRHYKPLGLSQREDEDGHHHLSITLVNLFVNVSITISIYVGIRLYYKREVLSARFRHRRMIPSSIFRITLALEETCTVLKTPQKPTTSQIGTTSIEAARILSAPALSTRHQSQSLLLSTLWRSVRVLADYDPAWNQSSVRSLQLSTTAQSTSDIQQLELIRPRVTSFSPSDTLVRGLNGTGSDSMRRLLVLTAAASLSLSVYGLTSKLYAAVASKAGLALSIAFFAILIAHCNRRMLQSLAKNFDALYASFQACASATSFGASLYEQSSKLYSIASLLLWLHLALWLDALLPDARHRLGLKKCYFAVLLLGAVVIIVLLMHSTVTGSSAVVPVLKNRAIFCLDSAELCIYTLSFLFMRLVSLLIVLLRVMWVLATQQDNELVFFRGRVEFCAPIHRLPFEIAELIESSRVVAVLPDAERQRESGER